MKVLDGMRFHRLMSVPRPPDAEPRSDPAQAQLFAALTAAHATLSAVEGDPGALAVIWVRTEPGGPVQLVVGGAPFFPPAGADVVPDGVDAPVLYPPGAVGRGTPAEQVVATLTSFDHWVPCGGRADVLWSQEPSAGDAPRGSSFEDFLAHLPHALAWLVLARPVDAERLERELDGLEVRIPRMRLKSNSEAERVELERAESRYRDLMKARIGGLWELRLGAGSRSGPLARATAAALCSANELDGLPYTLLPGTDIIDLAGLLVHDQELRGGATLPFTAGSDLLLATARTPTRELPGIRLVRAHGLDVTVEESAGPGWSLGAVLDRAYRPVGPFTVARDSLNRHAFICGATGSGKSQSMRSLLESLSRDPDPVPWLVLEPAKAEYARMAGRLEHGAVTVIRPGDPDVVPACLNPLEPEPGFPLQGHADLVRALFLAAFEVTEPFPQVLAQALGEVYADAGWDLVTSEPRPAHAPVFHVDDPRRPAERRYPRLGDLQHTARRVIAEIGYGPEVAANVRGFVDVRLGSLRHGTPGRFFDGGHPLDLPALLERNVVIELEGITSDQDKAFVIGIVLIRLVEHLRVRQAAGAPSGLRHVLVIEEAHRLLKNVEHGPAAAAVELFASLLAEIRAYGEGVAVVEQIPSKVLPDVLKNTAVKLMHRLPAAPDREAVGATINLDDEGSELVVALPPGRAVAATDGMDHPVVVQMPLREHYESAAGVRRDPPLLGRRSALCPAVCVDAPCTSRSVNDADHLAREPLLVLWCETVVISLLIGVPVPAASQRALWVLENQQERTVECALAHVVERSVDARRTLLRSWLSADRLAARVLAELRAQRHGETVVDEDWRRWTAGYHRWKDVRQRLRALPDDADPLPDHLWRGLGLDLDGATVVEQRARLDRHPSYQDGQERLVLGDTTTSLLVEAVVVVGGGRSRPCLENALRSVVAQEAVPEILREIAHLIIEGNA